MWRTVTIPARLSVIEKLCEVDEAVRPVRSDGRANASIARVALLRAVALTIALMFATVTGDAAAQDYPQPVAPLDRDLDGVPDANDNCPEVPNGDQADDDRDGIGNACENSEASPGPTHAARVVLRVEDDLVLVRPPGAPRFRPLRGAELVRIGSLVDTRRGTVKLTSAVNPSDRAVQTIAVNGGIFRFAQAARRNAPTDIQLRVPSTATPCPRVRAGAAARAARVSPTRARLSANGRGRFRVKTPNSTSSAKGTNWRTEERCDGTLTRVITGRVEVTDLRRGRTVTVTAGRSYLARARGAS